MAPDRLRLLRKLMSINEFFLFSQLCHGYKMRWMRSRWSSTLRAPCTSRRGHAPSTIVTTMLSVASTLRAHGLRLDVKSCAIIASTGAICGLVSCHTSRVASASPPWSVARRAPQGMVHPIAKGRNVATGQGERALWERTERATAALQPLAIQAGYSLRAAPCIGELRSL